jgi:hypothetical protein
MKRVFDFDVLRCPNCGGTMRLVAFIRNPKVAAAILRALDLPDTAPEPRPPRPPPTWD